MGANWGCTQLSLDDDMVWTHAHIWQVRIFLTHWRPPSFLRVDVGGGQPQDALGLLLLQPPLWAALAGIALCALGNLPLPPSIDTIAATLAPANKPLMLMAAGMTLPRLEVLPPLIRDQPKMVRPPRLPQSANMHVLSLTRL